MASTSATPNTTSASLSASGTPSSSTMTTTSTTTTPPSDDEKWTGPAAMAAAAAATPRGLPQAIAHRGFRARLPENTLAAFRAALDDGGGAVALETDLHLTRDKVVVLSHDATLKRCFGRPDRLADCDWAALAPLRTTRAPPQPMPRLADLLALLAEPGREAAWLLLDIKRDNDPEEIVTRTAETIQAVPGDWRRRIVVGCWDPTFMRLAREKLPGFDIAYIGFSLAYSYELLDYDCVPVFNLLQSVLVGARGKRFLREAHARGRLVLVWTVNDEEWMDWSIHCGFDGVITDDPALFARVRKRWETEDAAGTAGAAGELAATEATPLTAAARRALLPPPPPTLHPPTATTRTGFYIRRWARLYAFVALVRVVEQVFNNVMRLRFGWERKRVREALGP